MVTGRKIDNKIKVAELSTLENVQNLMNGKSFNETYYEFDLSDCLNLVETGDPNSVENKEEIEKSKKMHKLQTYFYDNYNSIKDDLIQNHGLKGMYRVFLYSDNDQIKYTYGKSFEDLSEKMANETYCGQDMWIE